MLDMIPDIPAHLDRRPLIWSYTMLNTYRNVCAHQTYRRYVLKKGDAGHVPFVMTDAVAHGNAVHEALEYRVQGGKVLPLSMQSYEPLARAFDGRNVRAEPKLGVTRAGAACDFFAKDVWGRGKADVVLLAETKAYLVDWKTGNVREDPFELEVQAVLLKAKYPKLQIIKGQFAWLKEHRLGPVHDLSDTEAAWGIIRHLVGLIETDRKNGVFDKEPGPLCGWCDVLDCEFNKKSR